VSELFRVGQMNSLSGFQRCFFSTSNIKNKNERGGGQILSLELPISLLLTSSGYPVVELGKTTQKWACLSTLIT